MRTIKKRNVYVLCIHITFIGHHKNRGEEENLNKLPQIKSQINYKIKITLTHSLKKRRS